MATLPLRNHPPRNQRESVKKAMALSQNAWNRSRRSMDQSGFEGISPNSSPNRLVVDDIQFHASTHKNLLSTSYQFADRIRVIQIKGNEEYRGQPVYQSRGQMFRPGNAPKTFRMSHA